MDDVVVVTIDNGGEYLFHDGCGLFFCETALLSEAVEEFPTLTKVSDQVVVKSVLVEFVQLDNVGVIQRAQDFHFGEQRLLVLFDEVGFEDLLHGPHHPYISEVGYATFC